jgi:hypothetical protein
MSWAGRGWLELARSVGEALRELARAEVAALVADLSASSRQLLRGSLLLVAAVTCGCVALASAALVGFELLALVWPRWAAALAICGASALAAVVLAALGRRRLRRVERPLALVRRRAEDHVAWWRRTFGSEEAGPASGDLSDAPE